MARLQSVEKLLSLNEFDKNSIVKMENLPSLPYGYIMVNILLKENILRRNSRGYYQILSKVKRKDIERFIGDAREESILRGNLKFLQYRGLTISAFSND